MINNQTRNKTIATRNCMDEKEVIDMYFRNEYDFLSNFYRSPIVVGKYTFQCAEAAFQAMKCTKESDVIALTKMNGAEAKKFGRRVDLRKNWNTYRLRAMQYVLDLKFQQNPGLLSRLKAIEEPIVENNTWNDTFWGVCNGVGKNHLGKILTAIKEKV